MRAMSPRESRLVAILVLVALIVLVDVAIIAPIVGGFADRAARRDALTVRYAANDRIIAAIPRLRRQAERQQRLLGDYALVAPDAATAAELLRERMQAAIGAVGGDVRGGETMPAPAGLAATRIVARLDNGQLGAALARLENDTPYIVLTGLEVAANDALVTGHAAAMDVTLDAQIAYHPAAR